jgi:hypothetical protein
VRGKHGVKLGLVVTWHDSQKRLPIVALKQAA